jgi:hypothetical protein
MDDDCHSITSALHIRIISGEKAGQDNPSLAAGWSRSLLLARARITTATVVGSSLAVLRLNYGTTHNLFNVTSLANVFFWSQRAPPSISSKETAT